MEGEASIKVFLIKFQTKMRQLELERNAKYSMLRCVFSVNEKILFHRLALRISFTRPCKPKSERESDFVNFRL